MNPQDDPGAVFLKAMPETTPPPAQFDLDKIVRDGYRSRNRHRAVLGGAVTTGVAAVAAVLALSLVGLPADRDDGVQSADEFGFDPAMAGYPGSAGSLDKVDVPREALNAAVRDAFGDLAIEAGFLDADALDYELPSAEEVTETMEDLGVDYDEALSELGFHDLPLQFVPWSSPGNDGQVYLRGYTARDGDEEAERSSFTIEALQPGGWTAEPGPIGSQAFPQHLISDQAQYTDTAPEFTQEVLDDGRTLLTADHGCAYTVALVYPNQSALRSSWDLDCEDQGRELSLDELTEAMLAMPEVDYDTSELAPIGDLIDVPAGWVYDEAWEQDAAADSQASLDAASEVIGGAYPGAQLESSGPGQGAYTDGSSTGPRWYTGSFTMPFDDESGFPVTGSVSYFLPGGWIEGYSVDGQHGEMYLENCSTDDDGKNTDCEQSKVDGRTVVVKTYQIGEDHHSYFVTVFDPAGWAVRYETSSEGVPADYSVEEVVDMVTALPAPVYDAEEYARGE